MPTIQLLDKSVAELIAAGEVIERPSSVIKELIENSVDAGAKHITIEIKSGGISYMRITDDGCGIAFSEIPTAFLRHATSKIRKADDLDCIGTMGFRGEALASVAAVARVEMMTKRECDELGGRYKIEGGEQTEYESCGCPNGTTVIIRDLFYNTPARLKFLKKDVSEGNFIASVVDKLALAHPDISFRFIRDNKSVRLTFGDGSLISTIKAVFGRQLAESFVPVDFSINDIEVTGFVSSPLFCRASRSMQTFFVNNRYIKSTTCMAALEEAYRNSIMVGKFPACVIFIKIRPETVDVNVHPAKTEIRFAYEKPVFDAVYLATKNALVNCANDKKQIELKPAEPAKPKYESRADYFAKNPEIKPAIQQTLTEKITAPVTEIKTEEVNVQTVYPKNIPVTPAFHSTRAEYNVKNSLQNVKEEIKETIEISVQEQKTTSKIPENKAEEVIPLSQPAVEEKSEEQSGFKYINAAINSDSTPKYTPHTVIKTEEPEPEKEIRVIGEFSATYIICEAEEKLILIDKHAAHERIRFEKLKEEFFDSSQLLIDRTEIRLSAEEYNALQEYYSFVEQTGLELMFEDDLTVSVTAMPTVVRCTPQELVSLIAERLMQGNTEQSGAMYDDILHSMACKSAIKANDRTDIAQLDALARRVYNDEKIRFCPHGRPVMIELSRAKLEHFFGRS
ncbi:MAG: DNA mismatch repair endonuclease MutL [Ruminococcaceae bacterium]|nr:DNA mismatch repair endonuclease MutL [Oscillospiraceae bacterium]